MLIWSCYTTRLGPPVDTTQCVLHDEGHKINFLCTVTTSCGTCIDNIWGTSKYPRSIILVVIAMGASMHVFVQTCCVYEFANILRMCHPLVDIDSLLPWCTWYLTLLCYLIQEDIGLVLSLISHNLLLIFWYFADCNTLWSLIEKVFPDGKQEPQSNFDRRTAATSAQRYFEVSGYEFSGEPKQAWALACSCIHS